MKLKHILFLSLVVIGGLYVFHIYSQHGGTAGFRSGLGV